MRKVRTRFAPSPTGFVHIGGLRTAIFNYLFARHHGGEFLLRIEDTDAERNFKGAVADVTNYLFWLGIKPTNIKGVGDRSFKFFYQSFRAGWRNETYSGHENNCYLQTAIKLVQQKKAYFCFCLKQATTCLCRNNNFLDVSNKKELQAKVFSKQFSVKLYVSGKEEVSWNDLVRGKVTFLTSNIEDFVLVRSNFLPTYNFANVVDDLQDEITHVFRGEEHITNTSKQLLLYQYLQKQPPQYGHLNVLVNSFFSSERYAKLSKRTFLKGEFSFFTSFYKNFNQTRTPTFESCFRDATINFLVFSGWTFVAPQQKIFSLGELEKMFDGKKLSKAPIVCETQKFFWSLIVLLKERWKLISQELIQETKLMEGKNNFKEHNIPTSFFKYWQRIIIDEVVDIFTEKEDNGKKVETLILLLKKIYQHVFLSKEKVMGKNEILNFFKGKLLFFLKKNESNFQFLNPNALDEALTLLKSSLLLYQEGKKDRLFLIDTFKQTLQKLFSFFFKKGGDNHVVYFFLRCFLTNFYHNGKQRWMPSIGDVVNFLPEDTFILRCQELKLFLNFMFAFYKKKFVATQEKLNFNKQVKKQLTQHLKGVCDLYFFDNFCEKKPVEVFFEDNYLQKKKTSSFTNKYFSPTACSTIFRKKIFLSQRFLLKKMFTLKVQKGTLFALKQFLNACQRTFLKSVFSFLESQTKTTQKLLKEKKELSNDLNDEKNYLLIVEEILSCCHSLLTNNKFSTLKPVLFLNEKVFEKLLIQQEWYKNEVRLKNMVGKITYLFAEIYPFPKKVFFTKKLFLIYFPQEVIFPFSFNISEHQKEDKITFYCPKKVSSKHKKINNFRFCTF